MTNVVLHAYRDRSQPGHIEVLGTVKATELLVIVRDAGDGLRAHHDSPGLGLGLTIIDHQANGFGLLDSHTDGVELQMHFDLAAAPGATGTHQADD